MLLLVVVASIALCDAGVVRVVRLLDVDYLVAVYVVGHIGSHVCLIVVQVDGSGTPVVGGEMIPVPGGAPADVAYAAQMGQDDRPLDEDRAHDVGRAVDVRCSDNLDVVVVVAGVLHHYGGDVLIDVPGEDCLDDEDVVAALYGLKDTEVVDVAVVVQVQVGDYVGGVVDQRLEFPDGAGLCKGSGDCL